jgi:hypothetical protein
MLSLYRFRLHTHPTENTAHIVDGACLSLSYLAVDVLLLNAVVWCGDMFTGPFPSSSSICHIMKCVCTHTIHVYKQATYAGELNQVVQPYSVTFLNERKEELSKLDLCYMHVQMPKKISGSVFYVCLFLFIYIYFQAISISHKNRKQGILSQRCFKLRIF